MAKKEALDEIERFAEQHEEFQQRTGFCDVIDLEDKDLKPEDIDEVFEAIIKKAPGVTSLDLSENELTRIPPIVGRLTELTHLHLNDNKIAELPRELGMLPKLEKLNMSENELTHWPQAFSVLQNNQCQVKIKIENNLLGPKAVADFQNRIDPSEATLAVKGLDTQKLVRTGPNELGADSVDPEAVVGRQWWVKSISGSKD